MVCWVLPLPVRPGIIQTCNKFVNGETEHTGKNEFVVKMKLSMVKMILLLVKI
jgi:hypothetical protein